MSFGRRRRAAAPWAAGARRAGGVCGHADAAAMSAPAIAGGALDVRQQTVEERRRLYLRVRFVISRHYARPLTVAAVARALASSPRQVHRAYALCSESSFSEELYARRMVAAAELLGQHSIAIGDVGRLVGYRQASHFTRAFRRAFGCTPEQYRRRLRGLPVESPVMLPAYGNPAAAQSASERIRSA